MYWCCSAAVQDPKSIGLRRIPVNHLERRPGPLPDADTWHAGESDRPAGAVDGNVPQELRAPRSAPASSPQHIGEDRDRVVALEGDEGGRLAQPLTDGCPDSRSQCAEALGEVAQEGIAV